MKRLSDWLWEKYSWHPVDSYMFVLVLVLALMGLLLHGCYLDHAAEPCDGGGDAEPLGYDAGEPGTFERVAAAGGSAPGVLGQAPACPGPVVAGKCYRNIQDVLSE